VFSVKPNIVQMKYPRRPVTTCEPCRLRKRKCDYKTKEHGPCSNCVMRKWEHLCTLPELNGVDSGPASVRSSVRKKQHQIPPPKFIMACVVRFFLTPEMSFYVNQERAMNAILELASGVTDSSHLSVLYMLSAQTLLRRGARISKEFGFEGHRVQLAEELLNMHLEGADQVSVPTDTCEALILRGMFYSDTGRYDQAWAALYEALAVYYSIGEEDRKDSRKSLAYDKLWLGLCTLESTLSHASSRKPDLPAQREGELEFVDFSLDRRWRVLCVARKVTLALGDGHDIVDEENLENEILGYIANIDNVEGKLHPYGQLELFVCLLKLRTREVIKHAGDVGHAQARDVLLKQLAENGTDFAIRLEIFTSLGRRSSHKTSCMGSAPYLAYIVFQGLTCIWILSALVKRLFILEPNFEEIKSRIWATLEHVRHDSKVCNHTYTLFQGVDLLSKNQAEGGDYNIKIPAQLQNGISSITDPWNGTNDEWMNFQPTFDDKLLWSYLVSHSDFDGSLQILNDLPPDGDMIVLN
jgi:hypothetical protein